MNRLQTDDKRYLRFYMGFGRGSSVNNPGPYQPNLMSSSRGQRPQTPTVNGYESEARIESAPHDRSFADLSVVNCDHSFVDMSSVVNCDHSSITGRSSTEQKV